MSTHDPKITVLMPAYNAGKYIREAVSSVLNQSFPDFELLIVNDGSSDNTLTILDTFSDERIKIINQKNNGIASALNNGLKHALAPYIARFDADDICYPDRLEIQYNFIISNPEYSIIGSAGDYIDVNGEHVFYHRPAGFRNREINQLSFKICPFIHSTVLYKKEVIKSFGGYNENAHTYKDHFLWAHILREEKGCNLPDSLIKVRLNPESVTIDEKWRTPEFRRIKYDTLRKLSITEAEGNQLLQIARKQHSPRIKEGAYYALLGKKYLWNNYQPEKARRNLIKTLWISPLRFKNYFLFAISYLPANILVTFYNAIKTNNRSSEPKLTDPVIVRKELNYDS